MCRSIIPGMLLSVKRSLRHEFKLVKEARDGILNIHYINCIIGSSLFDEFLCKFGWPTSAKKAQLSHERVEYNVFLFDEPLKGSKSLKIFKINLTFRFDKW
jgi:hypothetical protein